MTQQEALEQALERGKTITDPFAVGAWSTSRIKVLEKCPLQFFLQYVVKLRVTKPEDPDSVLNRNTGTTLHRVLELYYDGLTLPHAIEQAKEENLEIVTPERWDFVEEHYPQVRNFIHRMAVFQDKYPVAAIQPELKVALDRNYSPVDFDSPNAYIRGVMDLPIDLENEDAVIIDHKRGGSPFAFRYHTDQLSTYLLMKYFGDKPFRYGQPGIHYIERGDVVLGRRVEGSQVRDNLPLWMDNRIDTAIQSVKDAGVFYACKGSACTYCDYKELCRDGKRGTVGKLEDLQKQSKEML